MLTTLQIFTGRRKVSMTITSIILVNNLIDTCMLLSWTFIVILRNPDFYFLNCFLTFQPCLVAQSPIERKWSISNKTGEFLWYGCWYSFVCLFFIAAPFFQAFNMRKHFFNDKDTGYFRTQKREPNMKNPMTGNIYLCAFNVVISSTIKLC